MKIISTISLTLLLAVAISSCRKDDDLDVTPPVDLGGETAAPTAIDKWLLDSLTTPYNIAVKYRWDQWELALDKTLTPPDENKIIPAMSAIKRVWIDPYNAETGSDLFMKQYSPKQFKLVGSVEYNYNGTVLLGQAEGGNNIAFFDINQNFDQDPVSSIKRMIQTSHHEFAHILHQNVLYPPEFRGISAENGKAGYTATWFNIGSAQALANGYITPYSMASADEDFVEMIANMLMEGRSRFNEIVASTDAVSQQILRRKEQFVVNYFNTVWNIDFYSLQNRVQAALYNLAPVETAGDAYGFGNSFTWASVDPAQTAALPLSNSFRNMFNAARDAVENIPSTNLVLDSLAMVAVEANASVLAAFVTVNGTQAALGQYIFETAQSGAVVDYTYLGEDENGAALKDALQPLLDYFSNNAFLLSWHADPSQSVYPRVRFAPQSAPTSFFTAALYP